jgi:hypothetical protein
MLMREGYEIDTVGNSHPRATPLVGSTEGKHGVEHTSPAGREFAKVT